MTREEFAQITAYLALACGKDLSPEAHEVYFDLLGDLPADVAQLAARRVMLEHKWATFPSVAELRAAAVDSIRGQVAELSEAEAWALAWRVVGDTDPEVDGSFARACKKHKAPPLVVEAIRAFGLPSLCVGGGLDLEGRKRVADPVSVQRGQFLEIFKQLAARERRAALLPPAVQAGLEQRRAVPAGQVQALADSFSMPEQ